MKTPPAEFYIDPARLKSEREWFTFDPPKRDSGVRPFHSLMHHS